MASSSGVIAWKPKTFRRLFLLLLRHKSTAAASKQHQSHNREPHEFSEPSSYLGSWKSPEDPKEAERTLAMHRREYAKKVSEVRKEYIYEMEMLRAEKERKDEVKREKMRIANEERKAAKAKIAESHAAERRIANEELKQTLLKERQEKLEYWRARETKLKARKEEQDELLKRKSSIWIDEKELEKRILEAVIDPQSL